VVTATARRRRSEQRHLHHASDDCRRRWRAFKSRRAKPAGSSDQRRGHSQHLSPSVTESVGLSWRGSGANGAPTSMFPTTSLGSSDRLIGTISPADRELPQPLNSSMWRIRRFNRRLVTSGEWGVGPLATVIRRSACSTACAPASAPRPGRPSANRVPLGCAAGNHSVLLYTPFRSRRNSLT